jgi:predicted transcriptional regulator
MLFVKSVGGSIIGDVTVKVADKKDLEFMLSLKRSGVNRNVARVITFLKDQNERAFMDIEIATDLKQQKVGVMKAKALGIQARNRGSMSTLVSRHLYLPYD